VKLKGQAFNILNNRLQLKIKYANMVLTVLKRKIYILLLPLVWASITIGSYFNSGDENGCFALGVSVFCWLFLIIGQVNSLGEFLWYLMPVGIVTMALVGLLMYRLRVNYKVLLGIFITVFVLVFLFFIKDFESVQDLQYKHRSILAPIFSAANIGLYVGILFSLVGKLISKF
jgi:hypothetical protein